MKRPMSEDSGGGVWMVPWSVGKTSRPGSAYYPSIPFNKLAVFPLSQKSPFNMVSKFDLDTS